jgi:hypothetical protein
MFKKVSATTLALLAAMPLAVQASPADIQAKVTALTADGALSIEDVAAIGDACGTRCAPDESLAINAALTAPQGYTVSPETLIAAQTAAVMQNLNSEEQAKILGAKTLAGTEIPAAVLEVLSKARLAGAVAYDVQDGEWSPYTPSTEATENMTFSYTEITPEKLAADLADKTTESNWITGYSSNPAAATYTKKKGGTGHVISVYDEAYHEDHYARGSQGQKWANNCGFMSDGSLHCLPAARRWEGSDYILTNADLSRGMHMLYNGHIDIHAGEVVSVEMSGKPSKKAAKGEFAFVEPVALLKAWGFKVAPGVKVYYGNTSDGTPTIDEATHTIRAAK